ncbi:MAG: PPK2 family polyphosphate kinase [Oscillospiraceae bacterium]|jgi:PPK2 family polyphosphate:nucleotide phosphotransferase
MRSEKYKVDGSHDVKLSDFPTDAKHDKVRKDDIIRRFEKNKEKAETLLDAFYADKKEGLIIVIQAIDASGKDSLIKNVFSGLNPEAMNVRYFKVPTAEELAHDYLWRIHQNVPRRGEIAVFNRSHYEDLITVRVEDIWKGYRMSSRVLDESEDDFFDKRYRQVREFEEYLYENSYRMVKVFLHISKDEQKTQFLERIDDETKNWKFNPSDLSVRDKFDDYMDAFEEAINSTSTEHSPWYVLPGDQRWYTRFLMSEILVNELKECNPRYPKLSKSAKASLAECREKLVNEK